MTIEKVYRLSPDSVRSDWRIVGRDERDRLILRREGREGYMSIERGMLGEFFSEREVRMMLSAEELEKDRNGML